MASVNPDDRDRGLRLVGAVTGAVAAVSLVAIGATTALAASETRHQDELRAVAVSAGPATVNSTLGKPAAADPKPSAKAKSSKPKSKSKAKADQKSSKKSTEQSTAKNKSSPKPKKAPAVAVTSAPPSVPSTGS
jgi:hypothetical protein